VYRKHNATVLEYFKDRPSDLLVLNMETPSMSKWRELCHFFSKPIPAISFPQENVSFEPDYCI